MPQKTVIRVLVWFFMGCSVPTGVSAAQPSSASAIAVEAVVQQLQENQDLFLVDVREQQQFEQFRIPGSLNIPLFAIKTTRFLKGKPLVLVDEGSHPRQLAEICDQLRQIGFEAWFLFGGLNAWHARNANVPMPLQGDVFTLNALNKIPPHTLFAEQEWEHWLLLDVSPSGDPQTVEFLPQTISVPFDRDHPQQFLADVEQAVAHSAPRSEVFLVVISTQRGEDYEDIERVLRHTQIAPVFFLEGGFAAYTRFVAQQNQIRQGRQRELQTPCTPCAR